MEISKYKDNNILSQLSQMKIARVIIAILAIGLAVSMSVNAWQYDSNQQLNLRLETLNQSLAQVSQDLEEALQQISCYDSEHFLSQVNQSSAFQTPVSKSQAIALALAYGGWNETNLRGQLVVGRLDRIDFNASCACWERRSFVADPGADYSMSETLVEGDVIRTWYEWVVMVGNLGPYPLFHSCYCVDAENGQVRPMYAQLSGESVMLTGEMVSDPSTHWPNVHVGESFVINSEAIPVVLFTYDQYENHTVTVKVPGATLSINPPFGIPYFFTIQSDIFTVEAFIADSETGVMGINSVSINNVEIYDSHVVIYMN